MSRTLFDDFFGPVPLPEIPGLRYRPAFIDAAAERELVRHIDAAPWRATWQRRTQHYGFSYPEGGNRFARPEPLGPLPDWLAGLARRVADEGLLERPAENVVINEYLPGQGISPHLDLPAYGPTVISLSLLAPVLMDLVEVAGGRVEHVLLEPRSALVLGGAARRAWKHGIARRGSDLVQGVRTPRGRRISVTLRTLL